MGWFAHRLRNANVNVYDAQPLAASRGLTPERGVQEPTDAPPILSARRLRLWAHGITLTTALAATAAIVIRGWSEELARQVIIIVSVLSFLWAYSLTRASHNPFLLRHIEIVLWVNSVVLLFLSTAIIAMTGGALSPLYWMFLVLISVECLQDRQRGASVAWLAWVSFCVMILAQALQWLPDEHSGVSPEAQLLGNTRMFHAFGAALWYVVIAIGVTAWARWVGRYERELATRREAWAARERELDAERERTNAERASFGERTFELDQAKRKFETDRSKFDHERRQWELTRSEEAQHAADDKAAIQSQLRVGEEQRGKLTRLQQQLEDAQRTWEEQRVRTVKLLDDREAALAERAKALEAAQEGFEAQRAKTTQSLTQLEQTLLASFKQTGEEMAVMETRRRALEEAERAMDAKRATWDARHAAAVKALEQEHEEITRQAEALKAAETDLAAQQARAAQERAANEASLRDAQQPIEEARRALEAEQARFSREREALDAAIQEQQARVADREAELASLRAGHERRAAELAEQASALQAARAEAAQAQAALTQTSELLESKRRAWEEGQRKAVEQLAQREQLVNDQVVQVAAQAQELERMRVELQAERRAVTEQQQALAQASATLARDRDASVKAVEHSRGAMAQRAREALHDQAKKLREQHRELTAKERQLAEQAEQMQRAEAKLRRTDGEILKAKRDLEDERRIRAEELEAQRRDLDRSRQQLEAERAQLAQARHASAAQATGARDAAAQMKAREAELAGLRKELEQLERMLAEQQRAHDLNTQHWQETARRAEAAVKAQAEQTSALQRTIDQQRQELADRRKALESAREQKAAGRSAREQQLAAKAAELDERANELRALQARIEEERRALNEQQRQLSERTLAREQALAARLEQLTALQQELEQERGTMQPQRQDVAIEREQLAREREQLDAMQRELNDVRRQLVDASLHQAPESPSAETLTLLANEFNTPLASLNALLETLIGGDHGQIAPPLAQALGDIKTTHDRLRRIVADALDAARLEQGQLPIRPQAIAAQELLAPELALAQRLAESKGLTVSGEAPAALMVAADPEHARRILRTLLHNAVHYTARGSITLACTEERDRVVVTVTDTGVGIQPAQLGQLFAKPKLGTLVRGKGISLYLARSLAKAMRGELTLVTSELEEGSTFALILPKPSATAPAEAAVSVAA